MLQLGVLMITPIPNYETMILERDQINVVRFEKITKTEDPLLIIEYQLFDIILAIMFMRLIFLNRAIQNN